MREIVRAKELAKRFGVTPATVLAWARRGWIPSLRCGRRPILLNIAAVEMAMSERTAKRGNQI